MGFLDAVITIGIIAAAVFYLFRKFSKSKSSGCGCSSEGGCCGGSSHEGSSKTCDGSTHK
jgi:hypothetical protein